MEFFVGSSIPSQLKSVIFAASAKTSISPLTRTIWKPAGPLFFDSAFKIARALTVTAVRKADSGELDLETIQSQLDALAAWSDRIADMATKARTIQSSGKLIEQCATELKNDMDVRLIAVLGLGFTLRKTTSHQSFALRLVIVS